MANAWIQHVKEYAQKNGMKYPVAVGDPGCKAAYKKGTQKKNRKYRGGKNDVKPHPEAPNPEADPNAAAEPKTPVNNVEVNHNPNADSVGNNPFPISNISNSNSGTPPVPVTSIAGGKRRSRKAKGSKSRSKKSRKNKK